MQLIIIVQLYNHLYPRTRVQVKYPIQYVYIQYKSFDKHINPNYIDKEDIISYIFKFQLYMTMRGYVIELSYS